MKPYKDIAVIQDSRLQIVMEHGNSKMIYPVSTEAYIYSRECPINFQNSGEVIITAAK